MPDYGKFLNIRFRRLPSLGMYDVSARVGNKTYDFGYVDSKVMRVGGGWDSHAIFLNIIAPLERKAKLKTFGMGEMSETKTGWNLRVPYYA